MRPSSLRGGGTLQPSATAEEDVVAMRVEDDGDGIPAEVLPRLFELHTRRERTSATPGLGIGLLLVKRLADLHGGVVEGRSARAAAPAARSRDGCR